MRSRILGWIAASLTGLGLLASSYVIWAHAAGIPSLVARASYPDSTSRLEVDLSLAAKRPGYDAVTAVKWQAYTPLVRTHYCELAPQGMITIHGPKTKDFPYGAIYHLPFTAVLPIEGKRQHTVHYSFPPSTFVPTIPSGFVTKRAKVTLVWRMRTLSKPCSTARRSLGPPHPLGVQLP